jgi:hypothetical protein
LWTIAARSPTRRKWRSNCSSSQPPVRGWLGFLADSSVGRTANALRPADAFRFQLSEFQLFSFSPRFARPNPRPGAEPTPPPFGSRISDFGLPAARRARAASIQLSAINPQPQERQPADSLAVRMTTRTPQFLLSAFRSLLSPGCTVVVLVVFILVSVPSPFTARLWCGDRDKWCPLKTTPTGRPQSPRFLVKGRRARNK